MKTTSERISRAERHGCEVHFAERAMAALGLRIAFHHVSYGTRDNHTTLFLGGMN
jgi:hypothetical protein